MKTQKVEVEIPVIEGYEYIRFGKVNLGDCFCKPDFDSIELWDLPAESSYRYFVYKKLPEPELHTFRQVILKAGNNNFRRLVWEPDYLLNIRSGIIQSGRHLPALSKEDIFAEDWIISEWEK